MRLVHLDSGEEVTKGEQVLDFRNDPGVVTDWTPPKNPQSTGRVYVRNVDEPADHSGHGYYPSVFNMKFVDG